MADHVEDPLLRVQRGQLAAELGQRLDDAHARLAHPRPEGRGEADRPGAEDGDVADLVGHDSGQYERAGDFERAAERAAPQAVGRVGGGVADGLVGDAELHGGQAGELELAVVGVAGGLVADPADPDAGAAGGAQQRALDAAARGGGGGAQVERAAAADLVQRQAVDEVVRAVQCASGAGRRRARRGGPAARCRCAPRRRWRSARRRSAGRGGGSASPSETRVPTPLALSSAPGAGGTVSVWAMTTPQAVARRRHGCRPGSPSDPCRGLGSGRGRCAGRQPRTGAGRDLAPGVRRLTPPARGPRRARSARSRRRRWPELPQLRWRSSVDRP